MGGGNGRKVTAKSHAPLNATLFASIRVHWHPTGSRGLQKKVLAFGVGRATQHG